jgi:hypothetical protein
MTPAPGGGGNKAETELKTVGSLWSLPFSPWRGGEDKPPLLLEASSFSFDLRAPFAGFGRERVVTVSSRDGIGVPSSPEHPISSKTRNHPPASPKAKDPGFSEARDPLISPTGGGIAGGARRSLRLQSNHTNNHNRELAGTSSLPPGAAALALKDPDDDQTARRHQQSVIHPFGSTGSSGYLQPIKMEMGNRSEGRALVPSSHKSIRNKYIGGSDARGGSKHMEMSRDASSALTRCKDEVGWSRNKVDTSLVVEQHRQGWAPRDGARNYGMEEEVCRNTTTEELETSLSAVTGADKVDWQDENSDRSARSGDGDDGGAEQLVARIRESADTEASVLREQLAQLLAEDDEEMEGPDTASRGGEKWFPPEAPCSDDAHETPRTRVVVLRRHIAELVVARSMEKKEGDLLRQQVLMYPHC